jgi:flagellar protein FlaG
MIVYRFNWNNPEEISETDVAWKCLQTRRITVDSAAIKVNGQQVIDSSQLKSPGAATDALKLFEQRENTGTIEEKKVQASGQMTSRDVKDVLESFQDLSNTIQTKLNFTVHEENNEIVIKVIDKESNKLIRQFPSDEMLNLQDKMRDMAGFLFNANV